MSEVRCRECQTSVLPFSEVCPNCEIEFPADEFLGKVVRQNIAIEAVLGVGGMGTVYKGIETHLQRPVAVKVLNNMGTLTRRHVAYFMREAQVLSRLRHPNLVSVLDFGQEEDGTLFLVLEYIPGRTLNQLLELEFPFSHTRLLRILIQILGAIEEVHRHNIVHRDLKPGNVVLEEVAGQKDFVKVLDFGIAKILGDTDNGFFFRNGSKTDIGMAVGTPQYMSPEQAQGKELDPRSDIYSAGVLLYEMLTGHLPHESDNVLTMMVQRIGEDVEPPSARKPELGIPEGLDALCMRALERDPDARFATIEAFRLEAQRLLARLMGGGTSMSEGVMQLSTTGVQARMQRPSPRESRPTLETVAPPLAGTAAVLAIRPLVIRDTAHSARTEADRLMAIWNFLGKNIKKLGGQMQPPSRGLALAFFPSRRRGQGLVRASQAALAIRNAATQRFAYGRLQMGLTLDDVSPYNKSRGGGQQEATIKRAAALAHHAMAGQILIDSALHSTLAEVFQLEPWENKFELVGLRQSNDASQNSGADLQADVKAGFIGRNSLRHRLEAIWRRIGRKEAGEALLLVGPDGVGKSHTLGFVRRLARQAGIPVLEAYSDKRLIDRPFRPLFDLAVQAAGQHKAPAHRLEPDRFRQGLEMLGLSKEETAALRDQFISGTKDDPWLLFSGGLRSALPYAKIRRALHVFAPFERRLALTRALRELLRQTTSTGGAVVILEDLDQADIGTLGCLPGLCDLARSRPLMMIGTSKVQGLMGFDRFETVELGPLEQDQRVHFWQGVKALRTTQNKTNSPDMEQVGLDKLLNASKGMPLYLTRWAEQPLETTPLKINDLIAQQFAALPGRLRRLLLITSTMGSYFEERALEDLFPKATSLTPALEGAAQNAWIEPCPGIKGLWRFHNPALQETIYKSIPAADRQNYHRHIFKRLEEANKLLLTRAWQAHQSALPVETMKLAEQLGDRFTIAGAPDIGHEWYTIALDAHAQLSKGERREALLLKAASTLALSGHAGRAARLLSGATFRDRRHLARGGMLRSRFLLDSGDVEGAVRCSLETLKHIRRDNPVSAGLLVMAAESTARIGRPKEAAEHIAAALQSLERFQSELPDDLLHLNWQARLVEGSIATRDGRIEDAERALSAALHCARTDEDEVGVVQSLKTLTALLIRLRRTEEALTLCQEVRHDHRLKLPQLSHHVTLLRIEGRCHKALNQASEARQTFIDARRIAMEMGWHAIIPTLTRHIQ